MKEAKVNTTINIVASRKPGDNHSWVLRRGGFYKCILCGYTMCVEPYDDLIMGSGCPGGLEVNAS